jgi:L-alanine-DL-glutamate epimerase-like enolase superfamily enzyme
MTCLHIDACIPNFLIQECNIDLTSPFIHEVFMNLPVLEHGYLKLPERPGLGIEFNEEAATKYQYKPYDRPVIIQQDGSIGLE